MRHAHAPYRSIRTTVLACLLAAATAGDATAQSVDAETLYQRGRDLMKRGDIAGACEAFAGSLRIEPAVGTALNLADCREREHKLASAWEMFMRTTSLATRASAKPQADEARKRADKLASRLSRLRIAVAVRRDGLVVTRDGAAVDTASWNLAIPLDGGRHVIAATAPGHVAFSVTIDVAIEGDNVTVEVPALEEIRQVRIDKKISVAPAEHEAEDEPDIPARRRMSTQRWLALGAGGLGVAALGTGVALGLRARSGEAAARELCPGECFDPRAIQLGDRADRDATRSTIAFVAAGAVIAGGAALWIFGAPDGRAPSLALAPAGYGLVVRGGF